MGAARSVRLSGRARRLRVGDPASAGSDGVRRAVGSRGADIRKHFGALIVAVAVAAGSGIAAGQLPARPSNRAPLGPKERDAVIALLDAVDAAQRDGADADARFP